MSDELKDDGINVQIESIFIQSVNGRGFDARSIYERIEIRESLFSHAIHGSIDLEDENDNFELVPIIGQETITIKFEILDNIEVYSFRVYKITNIENDNPRRSRYRLYFVTADEMTNENVLVRQAYQDMKYSDMVKSIMSDYIQTNRKLYVEKTITKGTRVIPNIRPFKAINQLAKNSVSANDQSSNYIFFEARDGFFFVPITSFVRAGEPKYEYRYEEVVDDLNQESIGAHTDPFRVMELNVKKSSDFLDALDAGMFGGKLQMVDLVRRKIDKLEFNYFDEFGQFDHINNHPLFIEGEPFSPNSNVTITYSDENSKEHDYVDDHSDLDNPFLDSELRVRRRIQMQFFKNFVIEMVVMGNYTLSLGDIIKLNVAAKYGYEEDRQHRLLAGNSVITSITHVFARDKYLQHVELAKDSVRNSMEDSVV